MARNGCKRHLLPAGTTDELQLVDAGVGHALKTEMAHLHDEWLAQDDHLELWTGEVRVGRCGSKPGCAPLLSHQPTLSNPLQPALHQRVSPLFRCATRDPNAFVRPPLAQSGEFPLWRKRALITQLAAQAWENVCARFDFEAAATRLGMRMTIDGSGDELIRLEGVESYAFCDADGGDSDPGTFLQTDLDRR